MLTAETMIENLKGKKLIEGAEWFKENDPEMLEGMLQSKNWDCDHNNIVIEIRFEDYGTLLYAVPEDSRDSDRPSRNQPPWHEDSYDDWRDYPELASSYYHEVVSKKQKILDIISENPFLNLKEIAGFAGCSSNYVRTILSQEKLTLTELRKKFAKKAAQTGIKLRINR